MPNTDPYFKPLTNGQRAQIRAYINSVNTIHGEPLDPETINLAVSSIDGMLTDSFSFIDTSRQLRPDEAGDVFTWEASVDHYPEETPEEIAAWEAAERLHRETSIREHQAYIRNHRLQFDAGLTSTATLLLNKILTEENLKLTKTQTREHVEELINRIRDAYDTQPSPADATPPEKPS